MNSDPLQQILDAAQNSGLISGVQASRLTQEFRLEKPSTMQDAASLLCAMQVLTYEQAQRLLTALEIKKLLAGRYQIMEKLGEGGMGAVFKAHDTKLDRLVAIKVMSSRHVQNPDAVTRFQREAKALAKVSHQAIVQAHDADCDEDQHFLVMEFVEGVSLSRLLHENGKLTPTRAADYIYQAALGIQHAHERGLIHRDLKPGNLLAMHDGQVKILDLGLARFIQDLLPDSQVTREGTGLGTPDYMAPEQFHDARHADPRCDVYALGCTLYHLVTGRVPFPGSSLAEKAYAHENDEPTPLEQLCPDAPAGLVFAIRRMMAKEPADRFQSAREVAEALAPYVASSSPSLPQIQATTNWQGSQLALKSTRLIRPRRRYLPVTLGIVVGAACMLIGLALAWPWLFPGQPSSPPRNPAESVKAKDKDDKPEQPKIATNGQNENKEKEKPKEAKPTPPAIVRIPNGLTVAKDGTGEFKTIQEALNKVDSGMTIRVLDDATYTETLHLNRSGTQSGLTIDAPKGATILFPATKVGILVQSVPKVTLRGFRLRHQAEMNYMIGVSGKSQGLHLVDLDIKLDAPNTSAISLEGLAPSGELSLVENCIVKGGRSGLRVSGFLDYATPLPCGDIALRNNTILDSAQAILVLGEVRNVQVVGNRVAFANLTGIQLENIMAGSEQILIANNTILECKGAFRLWDNGDKTDLGAKITLANNLLLGSLGPDSVFLDSGGHPVNAKGPGDGKSLLQKWTWKNNWRETTEPKGLDAFSKGWIPVGTNDTRQDKIDVESRNPAQPSFVKPAKDSLLTKAGKGGDLPTWVGAVAPADAAPWDWQWTWDAFVHRRLTVSQDAKGGGRFRTISEALAKVRPGMTIRILDDAVYRESLAITHSSYQSGITLEAARNATVSFPKDSRGLLILNVPDVTVRGFRLTHEAELDYMVAAGGKSQGLRLNDLQLKITGNITVGMSLEGFERGDVAVVVENCTIHGGSAGLRVSGFANYTTPQPCHSLVLRDNTLLDNDKGILLVGTLKQVHIVGNRIGLAASGAIQLENILKGTEDVLIANNTTFNCGSGFRLWDDGKKTDFGKNVALVNNLFLGCPGPDLIFLDSGGSESNLRGSGPGGKLLAAWTWQANWREGVEPTGEDVASKSWIPVAPADRLLAKIEVLSRDSRHLDFLRPDVKSPLALSGTGKTDPAMPAYVGALPPTGVQPWDWEATWKARFGKK